jgi:hypothetical protein
MTFHQPAGLVNTCLRLRLVARRSENFAPIAVTVLFSNANAQYYRVTIIGGRTGAHYAG